MIDKVLVAVCCGLLLACWFLYHRTETLAMEQAHLTVALETARGQLQREIERGKRIEEITVRLERAEAQRQADLLEYARGLQQLRETDAALGDMLDIVVPDVVLRGLRSCPAGATR